MKKKLFIIAVLAIGMAACLGSCKKKTTEPTTDPTTDPTEEYVCPHDSLVHVMAVEPTAEENGCVEHYMCANCLATFADAQATTSIDNPILWATNYVIDDECIAETQFAEYAGDESYFYRACLNANNDIGDDGTLIPDYTGWENWGTTQWQAYWELIHEYHVGWGGEVELGSEQNAIPACIFGGFLSKIILKDKDGSVDELIKPFFEEDKNKPFERIEGKLDTIMQKLDDIQASIEKLSSQINIDKYKQRMDKRNTQLSKVSFYTKGYFRDLLNVFKGWKTKPFSQLPQSAKDSIYNITEKWRSQQGVDIEYETFELLRTFAQNWTTDLTMPGVYDTVAYLCVPWEHKGYAFREMARSVDVTVAAEAYLMDVYYHRTHGNNFEDSKFQDMNKNMTGYSIILKNKPVIHHDYFRCQIPGAEVNVKKELRKLDNPHDYFCSNTVKLQDDNDVEHLKSWLLPKTGIVSQNWYKIVYQYYANRTTSQDDHFLYRTLESIGFKNVPARTNGDDISGDWIIGECHCNFNDPDRSIEGLFYFRNFAFQAFRTGSGKDWFGFHTVVLKNNGNARYHAAVHKMTIQYIDPMLIKNNGEKIPNREFYVIEKYIIVKPY